jgi:hypothetical protein
VDVSFSLSLELLSYQKLSADQMLPGVDIQESENGERKMVFTQNLLLGFTNQTVQACSRLPLLFSFPATWGGRWRHAQRVKDWRGKSRGGGLPRRSDRQSLLPV